MCKKIFVGLFLLIALGLALTVSIWPHKMMPHIVFVTRFFESMLPVLAVGALIKYLCCGSSCCPCNPKKGK